MIIQYIQKMTDMIDRETLTVLINDLIEGLARFGCGMAGIPYDYDN